MTASVGHGLIEEIERVSALREQYKQFRGMRGVNVEPAICLMTAGIEEAKNAIADGDPVACIRCFNSLKEFKG
jgi:molybdopterin converting factor small subunit